MTVPGIEIDKICYGCVGDLDAPGIVCPHCGWDNSVREDKWGRLPAMTLKEGRFFIGKPLGAGGFGVTYIGRDLYAGEFEDARRAIKEFFPMGMAIRKNDGVSVSPSASEMVEPFEKRKQRSHREGQRIANVSASVSNVVRAYDCFPENGTMYIVMEYIDGDTLADIVKQRGRMSWQETYDCLKPVMKALDKMHVEHHIYHMDISPDNIMLRKRPDGSYGDPVILDFGASIEDAANGATRSRSSMVVRDGYTPPEQYAANLSELVESNNETARIDEYAICATMYFALTGNAPPSSTSRLTGGEIKPLPAFGGDIPDYVADAIARGMSLRAAERYSGVGELIRALEAPPPNPGKRKRRGMTEPERTKLTEPESTGPTVADPNDGVQHKRKRTGLVVGVIVAAVVIAGGLAAFLMLRPRPRVIALNAEGQFTWTKSGAVEAGTLVGMAGDQEIRYELADSEMVTLTGAMIDNYTWSLEETRADGSTRTTAIQKAGDRG